MNELKAGVIATPHNEGMSFHRGSGVIAVTELETEFYLKSEADKVIAELKGYRDECERQFQVKVDEVIDLTNKLDDKDIQICHHKYKRCLAMAEMCKARYDEEDAKVNGSGVSWEYINKEMKYWERWRWRWEALAEKFKPEVK